MKIVSTLATLLISTQTHTHTYINTFCEVRLEVKISISFLHFSGRSNGAEIKLFGGQQDDGVEEEATLFSCPLQWKLMFILAVVIF